MGGRRLIVWMALLALLAGGCGGGEETGAPEPPPVLGYVPRDAGAVLLVPTDLEGSQLRRLDRLVAPQLRSGGIGSLREGFEQIARDAELDFEDDVAPLLGDTLVMAAGGSIGEPEGLLALKTGDGERLRRLLEGLDAEPNGEHRGATLYDGAAIDGDVLLVSLDTDLRRAIDRERDGDGLTEQAFAEHMEGVPGDALVSGFGTPPGLLGADPALLKAAELPWIAAAQGASAWLALEKDAIRGEARVRTDPDGLGEDDLPLAAGEEAPRVPKVEGAFAGGNRNQSRTTVFLAQVARRAFPNSAFVREVESIERDLGVTFEEEVLAQFNGPSASVAHPDGEFAAVSELADPDRMRTLLPRLAPRLPGVLRGLEGLGRRGLVALLLFAPDAPLVPGALPLLQAGIEVVPIDGPAGEQLYRVKGLEAFAPGGRPIPTDEVVFGMIGERFVVGSSEDQARVAAALDVEEVDGARGAAVSFADLSRFAPEDVRLATGIEMVPLGELVGELEVSTEGLEGRLRIEVPGGLE